MRCPQHRPRLPAAAPAPTGALPAEQQPPTIQLRFGTAIYDGVRGSYCWNPTSGPAAAAGPDACTDVLPAFDTVLAWPAGEPLEWVINGRAPTALGLTVYSRPTDPLVLQTELVPGTDSVWQPTVRAGRLMCWG